MMQKPVNHLPKPTKPAIIVSADQAHKLPGIINKAEPGTTILLGDGTYLVQNVLRFTKDHVTLRSKSGNREAVNIDGEYKGYLIQLAAPYITIADMTLKRAQKHLIHVTGNAHHAQLQNLHLIDARQQFVKVNPTKQGYPDFGTLACSHFELDRYGAEQGRSSDHRLLYGWFGCPFGSRLESKGQSF